MHTLEPLAGASIIAAAAVVMFALLVGGRVTIRIGDFEVTAFRSRRPRRRRKTKGSRE